MNPSDSFDTNPYQSPAIASSGDPLAHTQFPIHERAEITPDLLVEAHFARFGTATLLIRIAAIVVGFACLSIGGYAIYEGRMNTYRLLILAAVICVPGAMLTLWGFVGKQITAASLRHWFAFRQLRYTADFEIGREALTVRSPTGVKQFPWSELQKWRGNDNVLTGGNPRQPDILPIGAFSAETQEIVGLLRHQ